MSTQQPAILAEGLSKRYGATVAVADISLRVEVGETLGILGTNGAGKTTTVEMMAGLRSPDTGSVRILGMDPGHERAAVRQALGVQLQESHLHGSLRVIELINLYRTFYRHPRATEELLDLVQLGEQRRTMFQKLSGGQQQRLSVALALVGRPSVVILDELTTGLDPKARRRMWAMVEGVQAEGVSVVLVSHAMQEVERLCQRIALIDGGRISYQGTPQGLMDEAGTTSLEEAFVRLTGHEMEEAS